MDKYDKYSHIRGTLVMVICISILANLARAQLVDSPWPMYGHDERHTFSSPYKGPDSVRVAWIFETEDRSLSDDIILSAPVIGKDGTIYLSTEYSLKAIDKRGVLKWSYVFPSVSRDDHPKLAISSDGTIYTAREGDWHGSYLFAITKNGNLKWKYQIQNYSRFSAPAIGNDGTIYFGHSKGISAVNADGTLKWNYETEKQIDSSPAISLDGFIYVGGGIDVSSPRYLHAFYINGYLKWKFASAMSRFSPSIASSGTIYYGDSYRSKPFYALSPDGSVKWQYLRSPNYIAIGPKGDIYGNFLESGDPSYYKIVAFDSERGNIKWSYNYPNNSYSGPFLVDSEGIIYQIGDSTIIAINPNGTFKWKNEELPGKASSVYGIVLGSNKDIYIIIDDDKLCALFETPIDWPPMMPESLRAIPGHEQVLLAWSPNQESDIAYYCVYRSIMNNFVPTVDDSIARVNAPDTTYLDIGLSNGTTYYYRICAVDITGIRSDFTNQVSATPAFNPDFLTVTFPVSGSFVNKSPVLVQGKAIAPYVVKVEVNGNEVSIVDNSFECYVDLNEGTNQIIVVGYDNQNVSVLEKKIIVKLDSMVPDVKITSPYSEQNFSYSPVKIRGRISESNLVSLLINDIQPKIEGNTFLLGENHAEGLEIEEGWFWIKAVAIDSAGNIGTDSVRVKGSPPSHRKLYLKDNTLSRFPFPSYPSGTTQGYSMSIIVDEHSWKFPIKGDISGSGYKFSLLVGHLGFGDCQLKAQLILRRNNIETVLASSEPFETSAAGYVPIPPDYYMKPKRKDFSFTGVDPESIAGDTLVFKVTKMSGDRVGLVFIQELHLGQSWIEIPEIVEPGTSVYEEFTKIIPENYNLSQNYPNPFNPETTIEYQLPKISKVTIKAFNMTGQLIKTLANLEQSAGDYIVTWNGKNDKGQDVASGVYFYRLKAKGSSSSHGQSFVQTRKMLLVR